MISTEINDRYVLQHNSAVNEILSLNKEDLSIDEFQRRVGIILQLHAQDVTINTIQALVSDGYKEFEQVIVSLEKIQEIRNKE